MPHHTRQASFNPRSRMGSDIDSGDLQPLWEVSIHAPAWGATGMSKKSRNPVTRFNPRSRMGSDGYKIKNWGKLIVSIHAPAWGATQL